MIRMVVVGIGSSTQLGATTNETRSVYCTRTHPDVTTMARDWSSGRGVVQLLPADWCTDHVLGMRYNCRGPNHQPISVDLRYRFTLQSSSRHTRHLTLAITQPVRAGSTASPESVWFLVNMKLKKCQMTTTFFHLLVSVFLYIHETYFSNVVVALNISSYWDNG
jgi:hypothetical protein